MTLTMLRRSRQIGALEQWLGQHLFVRSARRMNATPVVRAFASEVSLSFDRIAAAAEISHHALVRQVIQVNARDRGQG
jgi:DNA-binding transcriptional LysR family regulator